MTGAPQIIAGACGYGAWPENSLEGARACLAAPVDGIEIDVHLTSDGHVVAYHDYRVAADGARLDGAFLDAPGPRLRDTPLAELRRYDVGRRRPGSPSAQSHPRVQEMDGVVMPTLPELLAALAQATGPRRWLFVEIKTEPYANRASADPVALTRAVLRDIDQAGWADRTKIIAFDWSVLRQVREGRPNLLTAHLTIPTSLQPRIRRLPDGASPWADGCDPARFDGSELRAIQAHGGREWSPHISEVTPERVAEARDLGLAVGVWGVATPSQIARMTALGADALTVSGPDWSA